MREVLLIRAHDSRTRRTATTLLSVFGFMDSAARDSH